MVPCCGPLLLFFVVAFLVVFVAAPDCVSCCGFCCGSCCGSCCRPWGVVLVYCLCCRVAVLVAFLLDPVVVRVLLLIAVLVVAPLLRQCLTHMCGPVLLGYVAGLILLFLLYSYWYSYQQS